MKIKKTGTLCTPITGQESKTIQLKGSHKKLIEVNFAGGDITSDGGVLLLRQADRKLNLTKSLSKILPDPRNQSLITHSWISMLKQRIFGIALGYEDLNDHETLRKDPAIQAAVECENDLASTSTLFRMEHTASRESMVMLHELLFEKFIASFAHPPKELILDFDATDDTIHGTQEGRFFNGYYRDYCFLPLYVFCGHHLLVAYLRPSNEDGAKHAWAILSLLVKAIRNKWPDTNIVFRGDAGFCRHKMFSWCERHNVGYVVGIGKNSRLLSLSESYLSQSEEYFSHTQEKQRIFGEVQYAADTWDKERRVIVKAEHSDKGANPRFVVTNRKEDAEQIYDKLYCARGDMENRIKEQQLGLFADRTSCHAWWPNQLRLLFSGMAYLLLSYIRSHALQGTSLATAQVDTIRLRLLKIGAAIIRNTRRIRFLLSSGFPNQKLFFRVLARLTPS
jgi:Transposase DDE domain group 1